MAIAVSLYFVLVSPILLFNSFGEYQVKIMDLLIPIGKYFLMSFLIFGGCYFFVKYYDLKLLTNLIVNVFIAPIIYFGILFLLDKEFTLLLKEIKNVRKK